MASRSRQNRRSNGLPPQDNSKANMSNCGSGLSTKEIFKNLLIMIPSFYMMFYCVSSIVHAIYKLSFHARAPFYIKECCLDKSTYQVTGISLVATYFLSTFPFILVTTRRLWDHITTITIFHTLMTSAVMLEFPTNWQWWVALAIGCVSAIIFGESLAFCMRKRKSRNESRQANEVGT